MLKEPDFLNTLIQRESGDVPHPISPRLPSRYEPVDRKFSFSAFDEEEPLPTDPEETPLDTHSVRMPPHDRPYPDTRSMGEDSPQRKYSAGLATDTDMPAAHNEQAPSFVSRPSAGGFRPGNAITEPVNQVKGSPPAPLVKPLPEELETPRAVTATTETTPIPRTPATSPSELEDSKFLQPDNESIRGIELQPAKGQRSTSAPIASPEGATRISGNRRHKQDESSIPVSPGDTAVTLEPAEGYPNEQAPQLASHRAATGFPNPAKDVVKPAAPIPASVNPDNKKSKDVVPPPADQNIKYDTHNHAAPKAAHRPIPARVTARETGHITPAPPPHVLANTNMRPHRERAALPAPVPVPEPTINVTIGRIEVRAITPPATPKHDKASGPKPMSLSEYLGQHSRNSRRTLR